MNELRTKMTALVGILLLVPLVATLSNANINSDQQAADQTALGGVAGPQDNDYCTAVDVDQAASGVPTGDDDDCDANSEDTGGQLLSLGGNLINCVDPPTANGLLTTCTDGAYTFADTAFGAGNFGGDYPEATTVTFTNVAGGPMWYNFRVCARNVVTGVMDADGLGNACIDDFTAGPGFPGTCLPNGGTRTFTVGGGGSSTATDPVAGTTIDGVYAFANIWLPVGSCGMFMPGPRTFTFDWTYSVTGANGNTAVAANVAANTCGYTPPAAGPNKPMVTVAVPVSSVDKYCATASVGAGAGAFGYYGECNVYLYDITPGGVYDSLAFGVSASCAGAGSSATVSDALNGVLSCPTQFSVQQVATSWKIGSAYKQDESLTTLC